MFEFEDVSSGFHDVFLNKYADSSGPILDFYISDSMQDMLDIDIRTEVATVVGGANEFSSLINDLPSLDLDLNSNDGDTSWVGGPKWSATNDIYADVGACVNPNSVMPLITSAVLSSPKCQLNLNTNNFHANNSPLPSPKEKKSHLTFSPNQIKVSSIQEIKRPQLISTLSTTSSPSTNSKNHLVESVKKDLVTELNDEKIVKTLPSILSNNILSSSGNTIKLAPGIGGLTFANSLSYQKLKPTTNHKISTINNNLAAQIKKERDSSPHRLNQQHSINNTTSIINGSIYSTSSSNNNSNNTSAKLIARNNIIQTKNGITTNVMNAISSQQQTINHNQNSSMISKNNIKASSTGHEYEYPKPAYSYSCLIAMALKNSRSGSLPVSEIYSFMCEHFPYFKTAPNGWKNSVRHNLSLNKSFEKIEKPATNGGQRKGCLWAMNPSKISKMDEEVQKWSRKDPMAIRNAMVHPENLESLERGEMKHGSTGDSDGENDIQSDVEENSDSEQDNEIDEHLIETPESLDDDDEEQEKEFDIEITDFYDAIDLNESKETLRLPTICRNDLIGTDNNLKTPKRARLDINCSISPADAFEHRQIHHSQQPIQHQSRRKMQLVNRIV